MLPLIATEVPTAPDVGERLVIVEAAADATLRERPGKAIRGRVDCCGSLLRYDLREIRTAIDRYKDDADRNLIWGQAGTEGYPPNLEVLVSGIQRTGGIQEHIRYLRRIPIDPMTGNKDWGLRSVQDDPDTTSWGGQDVFDVHSQSTGTALDGTKYSDW